MIRLLPWLLLAVSLAANVLLWRNPTPSASTSSQPFNSPLPTPTAPPPSAPAFDSSRDLPPNSSPALNSQLSTLNSPSAPPSATLASTPSRSSAFRGYADLLAEDVKTQEQLGSLNQLLARWVATDPTAAATWLSQYDEAPFYDPAALHVSNHLVATQRFTEASAWADLIRDPALREDARDAIIAESFRAKKIDASAVRLSGLPSARIEAILNGSRLD